MNFKVEIFGREHAVYLSDSKLAKACEDHDVEADGTTGLYVSTEREIYVSTAQEPEDVVQTLLHEVLHAIGHVAGHTILSHSSAKNEAFVNAVANGILDLLKSKEAFVTIGTLLGHLKVGEKSEG